VNPQTIYEWCKRGGDEDGSYTPHHPHTTLTPAQKVLASAPEDLSPDLLHMLAVTAVGEALAGAFEVAGAAEGDAVAGGGVAAARELPLAGFAERCPGGVG
jgi:hypothetical protein